MSSRAALVQLALCALDEAMEAAEAGPIEPGFGVRLALAYLYSVGNRGRRDADDFWRELQRPVPPEGEKDHRGGRCYSALQGLVAGTGTRSTRELMDGLRETRRRHTREAIDARRLAKVISDEKALRAELDRKRHEGRDCGWL